ncbi:MAG: prolyl oligopeptidase family serine peptidase [Bacteroidales bacterium]|nr:prolyl oligopeptidase family serine peptidase [Bacteroidales bacterium]
MRKYRILIACIVLMSLSDSVFAQKLTEFLPEGRKADTAVVVCPGGSYYWLAKRGEGSEVAQWLNANGYAAYVLEYPVSGWWSWFTHIRRSCCTQYPGQLNALEDALKTVKSKGYTMVGAMGFSAGGHLVMSGAELLPDSTAPDFVAPIYPVITMREPYVHKRSRRGLMGERRQHDPMMWDSLSLELHAAQVRCPVFLLSCVDDPTVDWHNAKMMADSLKAYDKVNVYYMNPQQGGHGFGVNRDKMDKYEVKDVLAWPDEFLAWLRRGAR